MGVHVGNIGIGVVTWYRVRVSAVIYELCPDVDQSKGRCMLQDRVPQKTLWEKTTGLRAVAVALTLAGFNQFYCQMFQLF